MDEFVLEHLKPLFKKKKILIGVTGGIAAYKVCELIRLLKKMDAKVRVVMTDSAKQFVTPLTLATLSEHQVYSTEWDEKGFKMPHIELSRWADLLIIAPATANNIAKCAQGLADDLLSTLFLAFEKPVWVAPTMNPVMYQNQAVQDNLKILKERGVYLLEPQAGETACGEVGVGRMMEPGAIVLRLSKNFFEPRKNKRIILTIGPTRSYLDPVRYLSNRSSGKMGAAFAWAALARGYDVTVIAGPTNEVLPPNAEVIPVETADEMKEAALKVWKHSNNIAGKRADVFLGIAAVLDWKVKNFSNKKIKKTDIQKEFHVELEMAPDILNLIAQQKSLEQKVFGFAAETHDPIQHAKEKLLKKNIDGIFANDVSQKGIGFESLENSGWWITHSEVERISHSSKQMIAHRILDMIEPSIPPHQNHENILQH